MGGLPVGYLQAWPRIRFQHGTTVKQIQVVRVGLEPGTSRLQVWCPNHSATPPPYRTLQDPINNGYGGWIITL